MSTLCNLALSMALRRRDDRELEYQIGDPVVSEGLNYWPPWVDPMLGQNFQVLDGRLTGGVLTLPTCYDDRVRYGGYSNFPYRITGIVTDNAANPVSNAVCSLFRTADDTWMYDAVSKDGGQYDFGVSDTSTTYYIVAFDVGNGRQGVTVNTLTGS